MLLNDIILSAGYVFAMVFFGMVGVSFLLIAFHMINKATGYRLGKRKCWVMEKLGLTNKEKANK